MSTMVAGHWLSVRDGDPRARSLYIRHYSARSRAPHSQSPQGGEFCGPGEHMVLLTEDCSSLYVWRIERFRKDGQAGVNCAVFRNEGSTLSSDLIREADELAWTRWPNENRHFTYVDGSKVRSSNPGCCFIKAGWRRCGVSKGGLLILEVER